MLDSLGFIVKLQHSVHWDEIKSIAVYGFIARHTHFSLLDIMGLLETGHILAYVNEKYIGFLLVLCHIGLSE